MTSLNTVAADEMQTLLTLAEHLRSSFENEIERVKQAQKQYDELLNRYDDMMKQWAHDKEKISQQREEIGEENRKKNKHLIQKKKLRFFLCVKKNR